MKNLDLKKEWQSLYTAKRAPAFVDVPTIRFIMADGQGDPNNSASFNEAMGALYAVSYALKFMLKKSSAENYTVMPLEGLWWMEGGKTFDMHDRSDWRWTIMLAQPPPVTPSLYQTALAQVQEKKGLSGRERLRFESFTEGRAAQILHIGSYDNEESTLEKLYAFMQANGCKHRGKHHEIYLGDPRRAAPDKLRTILRQPVQ